jgi:hypothetical protein
MMPEALLAIVTRFPFPATNEGDNASKGYNKLGSQRSDSYAIMARNQLTEGNPQHNTRISGIGD